MTIAVIGGDGRQARLARLLAGDGYEVRTAALGDKPGVPVTEQLSAALAGADIAVLPINPVRADGTLNAPSETEEVRIGDTLSLIRPGTLVLAGRVGDALRRLAEGLGIELRDYFLREELTVANADITARCALRILMRELPMGCAGERVLVAGFGRIGKLLALKLRPLGADVTCSARRAGDMAWISALGLRAADTRALSGKLGSFDAVVNTVPALIFDEAALRKLREGAYVLDLASAPGGVDHAAAARLGVRTEHALALPGKMMPDAAAMAIRDAVTNIINEWECAN